MTINKHIKTSNKLLIGFLVVILVVPVIILMSYRNSIKANKYTIMNNRHWAKNMKHAKLEPFKFVVLKNEKEKYNKENKGEPGCNIVIGKDFEIDYPLATDEHNKLFVEYEQKGDTLFVVYNWPEQYFPSFDIVSQNLVQISAPGNVSVNANKVSVKIIPIKNIENDGMQTIDLKNADLSITNDFVENCIGCDTIYFDSALTTKLPGFRIVADNSDVVIKGEIKFGKSELNLSPNSSLMISDKVSFDSVVANLSPQTKVEAPYSFLKAIIK